MVPISLAIGVVLPLPFWVAVRLLLSSTTSQYRSLIIYLSPFPAQVLAKGRLPELQHFDNHAILLFPVGWNQHLCKVRVSLAYDMSGGQAVLITFWLFLSFTSPSMVIGIFSQWWVRTRYPRWFTKYKFVHPSLFPFSRISSIHFHILATSSLPAWTAVPKLSASSSTS
jgi:hypothetical protein